MGETGRSSRKRSRSGSNGRERSFKHKEKKSDRHKKKSKSHKSHKRSHREPSRSDSRERSRSRSRTRDKRSKRRSRSKSENRGKERNRRTLRRSRDGRRDRSKSPRTRRSKDPSSNTNDQSKSPNCINSPSKSESKDKPFDEAEPSKMVEQEATIAPKAETITETSRVVPVDVNRDVVLIQKDPEKPMSPDIQVVDEMEKRRQRLKLWQEQRKKQETEDMRLKKEAAPKKLTLWKTGDEDTKRKPPGSDTDPADSVEEAKDGEPGVDPLDAFMKSLEGEAVSQDRFTCSVRSTSAAVPKQTSRRLSAQTISIDEIQALSTDRNCKDAPDACGSFMRPEAATDDMDDMDTDENYPDPRSDDVPLGGVTPVRIEETDEERERREEREHEEFMAAIRGRSVAEQQAESTMRAQEMEIAERSTMSKKEDAGLGRIYQGKDEDAIGEETGLVETKSALQILQEQQKKREIKPVDHSKIDYAPFRKKFYIVPRKIKDMSDKEVEEIRAANEIKVRGKGCPRPVTKWTQCGLSTRLLQLIAKHEFKEPFAIQRQAMPAAMSGRDVIGIAKTGSGKTLAFLLPMFRHVLDQPPLLEGEGPIGLVMAPARELALQIYNEAKKFTKDLGLHVTCVYGGAGVAEQISKLKRGSDVVVCTPGRMIDLLCMNSGRLLSLQRVTYVVMDEADRMFDMGFEPQISKILMNIRPDRQTLLFSATFPKSVETLARRVLTKPVEITVGGRSQASGDIKQYVEVREEDDKFMRLLQLLGVWYEKGNVLIFVNTQQACDRVFQDLMKSGYPALSLHGGKDQMDRDYTIDDFKRKIRTLMVATSVAGRGLDVKDLVLVVNYHCPNHLEDYVHRVGRTGRAGRKGTSYTFISPDEEEYSPDIFKALEAAKQETPPDLVKMKDAFVDKVKKGEARYHSSGFKGKGFTFNEDEQSESQKMAALQRRQYEIDQGLIDTGDAEEEGERDDSVTVAVPQPAAQSTPKMLVEKAKETAAGLRVGGNIGDAGSEAKKKAHHIAQMLDMQYKHKQMATAAQSGAAHFEAEIEINDYPQQARWKVTQKEASDAITELTGAAIIARGSFVSTGRKPNPGERKLYLAIEGPTAAAVAEAKAEIQRILNETTLQVGLGGEKYGKYTV